MSDAKTILVIDDDPDVQSFCRNVLEADGYIVNAADTAAEGLRIAASRKPDLILLDVMMEESDSGFKAAEPLSKLCPIIMLTSIGDAATEVFDTSALPIKALLQKPVAPEALREKVRRAMS
jgi:CheY-like chemotaxis protein